MRDSAQRLPLILELFADQARRRPEAVAVTCGDERLTFRELDERSSRLAAALRGAAPGPGAPSGVRLDRSATLVTALFGVLKAGAAYVPLDPAYPAARLEFMVRDCGAGLVLTGGVGGRGRGVGRAHLAPWPRRRVPRGRTGRAGRPGRGGWGRSSAAYVIYTSGLTGDAQGRRGRAR